MSKSTRGPSISAAIAFIVLVFMVLFFVLDLVQPVNSFDSTSVELKSGQAIFIHCHGEPIYTPGVNMPGWGTVYCR